MELERKRERNSREETRHPGSQRNRGPFCLLIPGPGNFRTIWELSVEKNRQISGQITGEWALSFDRSGWNNFNELFQSVTRRPASDWVCFMKRQGQKAFPDYAPYRPASIATNFLFRATGKNLGTIPSAWINPSETNGCVNVPSAIILLN